GYALRICGEGHKAYVDKLHKIATELGISNRVDFAGPVEGSRKSEAFFGADVCVVPSHSENFGLVVAESLAHGTPVIASTGTPWRELNPKRAGHWIPNDPDS